MIYFKLLVPENKEEYSAIFFKSKLDILIIFKEVHEANSCSILFIKDVLI